MREKILVLTVLISMLCFVGSVSAATNTAIYSVVTATITTPDSAVPDEPFTIEYTGVVDGPSWAITAWFLHEGGTCADNPVWSSRDCTGTFVKGDGFVFGNTYSGTHTATKPAGTYTYWFCMGNRGGGHGWFDVCVGSDDIVVEEACTLSVESINTYIMNLDDSAFKNNADNRKAALENKLDAVQTLIDGGNYEDAIDKLTNDILAKMDGGNNDWITDTEAQADLQGLIDDLVSCL